LTKTTANQIGAQAARNNPSVFTDITLYSVRCFSVLPQDLENVKSLDN
jgi:hypothetical protein